MRENVLATARDVRAQLLKRRLPRDLAGQCGLAALLIAVKLADPWALRTGFYMAKDTRFGHKRYPHRHAWNHVGVTIVDVTATQFVGCRAAVNVVCAKDNVRYGETASGPDAIDDILTSWCGALREYRDLAAQLRQQLHEVAA